MGGDGGGGGWGGGWRLSGLGGNRQEGKGEGYTMHLLDVGKMDVVKLVGGKKINF